MTDVTTVVQIDWQDNGSWDDVTDDIRSQQGIVVQRGKDAARARAQPMIAAADVTLDDRNHRYTAENSGSDIYPFVLPDRPLKASFSVGTDLTYNEAAITYDEDDTYYQGVGTLDMFTGYTDEPQESRVIGERHVQFRALGAMTRLKGVIVSTALYAAIRTDEAVGHVLDAAGWPTEARVISTGDTTMNFWWLDKQDAFTALTDLLETEGAGASLYEDGAGYVHFENRNYRVIASRSTTSQVTFDAFEATSNPGFTFYAYTQGTRDVYNDVHMTVNVSYMWNGFEIWSHGQTLTLTGGQVFTQVIHLDDPVSAVTTPVLTTDYVVTSGSLSSVTTELLNANTVILTWTAGGGGVVLDGPGGSTEGPQMRGDQMRLQFQETASQTADPSPYFASRQRSLDLGQIGARQEISQPTAQALCDAAAAYFYEGMPIISIEFANRDQTRIDEMLQREISDRITIDGGANEFSGEAWIEQINHAITVGGRVARTGFICSRALRGTGGGYVENPGLWDEGAWDEALWGN